MLSLIVKHKNSAKEISKQLIERDVSTFKFLKIKSSSKRSMLNCDGMTYYCQTGGSRENSRDFDSFKCEEGLIVC